ncbi:MAG: DUF3795 domain-containing protein [Thermodesulfobacteriota bacterium]
MRKSMIGICGDDCQVCPRYLATQNGSSEEFEKVKELYVRLSLRDPDFPPQDLACYGCNPENKCAYGELRACACEKEVDNCGLCNGYPCGLILEAFKKSQKLHSLVARVCTPKEVGTLKKAFFSKKENLDRIHREMEEVETANTKIKATGL